jgi:hypothetical protein
MLRVADILTGISVIALGYVLALPIRRAILLRRHGVPRLPDMPKRILPPPLPPSRDGEDSKVSYALWCARQRTREALGEDRESPFGPGGPWD